MADVTKITSGTLIAAEKVEGTNVYNPQGEKLGTVDDIMIDKISGRAIYAVMSFGGFLGMGEKQHPLPWSSLKYDERQGGYVVTRRSSSSCAARSIHGCSSCLHCSSSGCGWLSADSARAPGDRHWRPSPSASWPSLWSTGRWRHAPIPYC